MRTPFWQLRATGCTVLTLHRVSSIVMRTPLMMSHPPDPAQTNEIVAWRRLAAAGVWSSVNRRPSIHSANTQVPRRDQHVSGQESTGRDSVISSPLREPRGTGRADSHGDEQLQA